MNLEHYATTAYPLPILIKPAILPKEFARNKDGKSVEMQFKCEHIYVVGMTGSGKSYAIRKMAELAETSGMPILIFDIEGEFASIAQSFSDILLVSQTSHPQFYDPDTIAACYDIIHRNGTSVIIELKGLDPLQQQAVVGAAITALMNVDPYRPRVIIIDEAHLLASSQAKSASRGAIENLMARGRKHYFTVVLATQRHTKVSVNARSQTAHKLIGLNKEPKEVDSIAKDLGLDPSAKEKVKRLVRGEFFYSANAADPILLDVSPTVSRHGPDEAKLDFAVFSRTPLDVVVRRLHAIKTPNREGEGASVVTKKWRETRSAPDDVVATPLAASKPAGKHADIRQKTLDILAAVDDHRLTHDELGLLLAVRPGSIAYDTALIELQRLGLVKRGKSSVALTVAGRDEAVAEKSIGVLAAALRSKVPVGERAFLDVIIAAKRTPVSLNQIAVQCGLSPRSRKLPKALVRLSRSGLIKQVQGRLRAVAGLPAAFEPLTCNGRAGATPLRPEAPLRFSLRQPSGRRDFPRRQTAKPQNGN